MLWKISLIALLSYLGAIGAPWFFGTTGGFYTLGRPLVASALVGLILGDMKTALEIGTVIQAMYIGVITPGAVMPFDVDYIGYLTPALIILSGAEAGISSALAVTVGLIGVTIWNIIWVVNVYFAHRADKYAAEGNGDGIKAMNIGAQLVNFLMRFVPAFLILYYGQGFLQNLSTIIPPFVTSFLNVLSGMLPALGIGLLLNMIVTDKIYLGIFVLGFMLVTYLHLPIIAVAVMGIVFSLLLFRFQGGGQHV